MDFSFEEITFGLLELESCTSLSFLKMISMCLRCSSSLLLKMILSSRYTITKLLQSYNTIEINCWKYAGACAKPEGTALNLYLPKGVRNAVFAWDYFVQCNVVITTLQIKCSEYSSTMQVCIHFINFWQRN